jgi:D-alanine-D-alanine ligase
MSKLERPIVGVVCGGRGAEAEVSRSSGRCVAEALRARFANVVVVEPDAAAGERLRSSGVEVVFPVLHGPPGEDGTFQGFLEIAGFPYVGSGVLASACAMNKAVAKTIFRSHGLPVAGDLLVHCAEGTAEAARRVADELGSDVVVKPASQGSAVGVLFADDPSSLEKALDEAFRYDAEVLVEARIEGREITVGILEREDGPEVLPVIEVRTPPGSWYDYEHRYTDGLSEHVIPAPLPEPQYRRTQELARLAHESLGCRDLSRADLIVPESGDPILLEVNTLPGMTPTSLYPDAARAAGLSFEDLVTHLAQRAFVRGAS